MTLPTPFRRDRGEREGKRKIPIELCSERLDRTGQRGGVCSRFSDSIAVILKDLKTNPINTEGKPEFPIGGWGWSGGGSRVAESHLLETHHRRPIPWSDLRK